MKSRRITTIMAVALVSTLIPYAPAVADSGTPAKVLASTTVTGNRTMVKVSGATTQSGPLWTAKIPTKIKLSKDSSGSSGMVTFKIKNIASGADGEEAEDVRVTIALWSAGGKQIQDRTLYDWSPVSSTTDFEYRIFASDGARPGKYVWLITTSSATYEGSSQKKVSVTIS